MTRYSPKPPSLPSSKDAVHQSMMRRQVRSPDQIFSDFMGQAGVLWILTGIAVLATLVVPALWIVTFSSVSLYYLWASSGKYRLPFKVPRNWGGTDYGASFPGGRGFREANGTLYLGQDQATGEELWMEDGDARRHGFFLGTTGSGKALPLDTPVLTTQGWVANGDLRPGDELFHPVSGWSRVVSIHPQGHIPAVRLWLADGRHADCSLGHLWHVRAHCRSDSGGEIQMAGFDENGRLMTAADIGIMTGMHGDKATLSIPLPRPYDGFWVYPGSPILSPDDAWRAVKSGLSCLDYMPSLHGTVAERIAFLKAWVGGRRRSHRAETFGIRLYDLSPSDAKIVKQIVWSLGGTASVLIPARRRKDLVEILMMFDGISEIWEDAATCRFAGNAGWIHVTEVVRLPDDVEMSCIRIDRDDGLYVMENHVVTHNTELLLGICSQTLMWSSGFMFIDGKGTPEFYARAWGLVRRFGREDDVRVLNFTDSGADPDAPSGGPDIQGNTLNPFSKGEAGQLMNLIVSLMGDSDKGVDIWKNRAMSLVTSAMQVLVQMRESGDILLDVQAIREFLPLGKGVNADLVKGRKIATWRDVPEEAWHEIRTRGGMIELYLRSMKGDFSRSTYLSLKGFFDSLPGFNILKALAGQDQDTKTAEQYGYLSMQLTKPLGSLADDYGHIFRTPLGEIDIDDVVLNRRILVVLLPALGKAKDEMRNCGKIVVSLTKMMMANAAGSTLSGSKQEIIDSNPTRAMNAFILVMDEAGYYMVDGIDTMMAQARALGFMIIVAGQDMAAMQSVSPQVAETAAANASIFAAGKTVDGDKTVGFIQKLFGQTKVSVTSGFERQSGVVFSRWVDRMDASFQDVEKVRIDELQNMSESEFYFLFSGTIVRASTFFVGTVGMSGFSKSTSVNKFIKVRGPMDRVPGLDQSVELRFVDGYLSAVEAMMKRASVKDPEPEKPITDGLTAMAEAAGKFLWRSGERAGHPDNVHGAWLGAMIAFRDVIAGDGQEADEDEHPWEAEIDYATEDGRVADPMDQLDSITAEIGEENAVAVERRRSTRSQAAERSRRDASSDIVSGLSRVAMSRSVPERHGGLIDLLLAQENARRAALRNRQVADLSEATSGDAERKSQEHRQSLGQYFATLAENSERFARIFAQEDVDGDMGMDILRRSGDLRPLPLEAMRDGHFVQTAVSEMEAMISKVAEGETA